MHMDDRDLSIYILEVVLEREPGSGSIQFSVWLHCSHVNASIDVCLVNGVCPGAFKRIIIYITCEGLVNERNGPESEVPESP